MISIILQQEKRLLFAGRVIPARQRCPPPAPAPLARPISRPANVGLKPCGALPAILAKNIRGGSLLKKYRAGKIKREHTVIDQLWPVLEQIAECDLVTSIIPGPISRLRARGLEVTFQRFTDTGLRLLAKNGSAIQEVYVVAPEKDAVLRWLAAAKIVQWQPEPEKKPVNGARSEAPAPLKSVVIPSDMECSACKRVILAGSRAVRMGRKNYYYVHTRCAR